MMADSHIFTSIGGAPTFRRLVDSFYARVERDPLLRPLFPADLTAGKEYQYLFLIQYFGGPADYAQLRGHPRLRMRHSSFVIGHAERDAWLGHMYAALDEVGVAEPARSIMRNYFANAATAMMNRLSP